MRPEKPNNFHKTVVSFSTDKWIKKTLNDLLDKPYTPDNRSKMINNFVKQGLSRIPDVLSDKEQFLCNNVDRYHKKAVERKIIEQENKSASVTKKKITFPDFIDNELVKVFFRLIDYNEPEAIEFELKKLLNSYKKRAEAFNQTEVIEKRLKEPLKYVFQKLEKKKRYSLLKYIDNEYNVNKYTNADLDGITRLKSKDKKVKVHER